MIKFFFLIFSIAIRLRNRSQTSHTAYRRHFAYVEQWQAENKRETGKEKEMTKNWYGIMFNNLLLISAEIMLRHLARSQQTFHKLVKIKYLSRYENERD